MYNVIGVRTKENKFYTFINAFKYQQKNYPNNKIIFNNGKQKKIVWNPIWETFDCGKLERI